MKPYRFHSIVVIFVLLSSLIVLISAEEEEKDLFIVESINTDENSTHIDEIDVHSIQIYDPKFDTKIISGYEAKPNQFPHQVAIFIFGYSGRVLFCGGSVISTEYVITAAHCIFEKPKRILVIMGTTRLMKYNKNEVRRDVQRYIIHKWFDRSSLRNDICLLQLRGPIKYTSKLINQHFLTKYTTFNHLQGPFHQLHYPTWPTSTRITLIQSPLFPVSVKPPTMAQPANV